MKQDTENSDMTKEDRKNVLLEFLNEYDLALPPTVIYRNLRLKWNITFSSSSIRNYLDEFVDDGLVMRLEPAPLETREIEEVESDEARAYYMITDSGKAAVSNRKLNQ